MPTGDTCPVCMSQAIRVVNTFVFPLPAPAKINADGKRPSESSVSSVTAFNCSGFKLFNKSFTEV